MEIDTSDFALEVVLSQLGEDMKRHMIEPHGQRFQLVAINYDVHKRK
jgi:hypothetical protein